MAQTKRKRRTKHRGNAAGTIEVRGRTGRPPSPAERKKQERDQRRQARLNQPPTWKASFNRALLASGFMLILLLVTSKGNFLAAILFAVLALVIYVPSGYYLERWLWQRRMRKGGQAR